MKLTKREYLEQFDDVKLTHATRLVVNAFASYAGCREMFMRQDKILERAGGIDVRSLRKAIKFLTENKFLLVEKDGVNRRYTLLLNENASEVAPQRKKRAKKNLETKDKIAQYVSTKLHINTVHNCINKVQNSTVSPHTTIYIINHNINHKYNLNNNHKQKLSFFDSQNQSFFKNKNVRFDVSAVSNLQIAKACISDCQTEKNEIENLLAENQKLKNALEAVESKNKSLCDEILNLNQKIENLAISAEINDIELQSLKAENEKLKEKREKREVLVQKRIERENAKNSKWATDEEIENFKFDVKHIDECVLVKKWNNDQIKLAERAFISQMQARKERNENPFKSPSLLALNYIRNGYLDKAVNAPKQYSGGTNNDVNSKSYNVDNCYKEDLARMRREEQEKKAKTFDVDFDPEEFVREFNRDNNIENLPARPEPVRQNLFGIGTRR